MLVRPPLNFCVGFLPSADGKGIMLAMIWNNDWWWVLFCKHEQFVWANAGHTLLSMDDKY